VLVSAVNESLNYSFPYTLAAQYPFWGTSGWWKENEFAISDQSAFLWNAFIHFPGPTTTNWCLEGNLLFKMLRILICAVIGHIKRYEPCVGSYLFFISCLFYGLSILCESDQNEICWKGFNFRFFSPKSVCTTWAAYVCVIHDRALCRLSPHARFTHITAQCTWISKAFCLDISIAGSTGNRHHVASAPSSRVRFQYKSKLYIAGPVPFFVPFISSCAARVI
jgi:hypothetical protein